MVKAIFFDVDGTLVSHTLRAVPESTRKALELLSEKGILRVLATGRHMLELDQLPLRDITFDGYITMNGQLSLDARGNVIGSNPITGEDKTALIRLFREKAIPLSLVEKDRMYVNFVNEQVTKAQWAISSPVPEVGEYNGEEIYQAVAYLDDDGEKELFRHLPGCKATRWDDHGIDIYSASGGKVIGIREYLKLMGISREQTMAFGDGENDMDMLRFAGCGVAMGNAEEAVRSCADYITDHIDNDGLYKALVSLGILD